MKTPQFWYRKNITARLLLPLGLVYSLITALRLKWAKPYQAPVPVICVGNLTAGGSGKTPVSLALAKMLVSGGKKPYFLTRGYGGKVKDVCVDVKIHTAAEVGDEPLLLACQAPVVVNPDRGKGARTALQNGADCLIMDDGFQNPTLEKNLSFLVFDGSVGVGNGYPIPAGPLRETFRSGLRRAQAVIILGEDKFSLASQTDLPVFYASVRPVRPQQKAGKILAFAGIGRPQKFYDSLAECGLDVVWTQDFPDHHAYTRAELEDLLTRAKRDHLTLMTTSKDLVKIPLDLRAFFNVLEIEVVWKDENALRAFLHRNGVL
jgi:tetraacyldisaccharide 4'-kinase